MGFPSRHSGQGRPSIPLSASTMSLDAESIALSLEQLAQVGEEQRPRVVIGRTAAQLQRRPTRPRWPLAADGIGDGEQRGEIVGLTVVERLGNLRLAAPDQLGMVAAPARQPPAHRFEFAHDAALAQPLHGLAAGPAAHDDVNAPAGHGVGQPPDAGQRHGCPRREPARLVLFAHVPHRPGARPRMAAVQHGPQLGVIVEACVVHLVEQKRRLAGLDGPEGRARRDARGR